MSIINQESIRVVSGYRFSQLLDRPLGTWVICHIAVGNPTGSDLHHYQYIEDTESNRDRDHEVARQQCLGMVADDDAYECLCILTVLPEPSPISALCWQIHRRLAVLMPLLRVWLHCPRASHGLLPRRSNLVGYAQWDARFDRFLLCQTIISSSFPGRSQVGFS
jgi:hypothetical protein